MTDTQHTFANISPPISAVERPDAPSSTEPAPSTTQPGPRANWSRRALIGGAGLLLAFVGQEVLDRRAIFGVLPGWLLLGAGGVLATAGLASSGVLRPASFTTQTSPTARLGRIRLLALGAAILLGAAALPGFVHLAQTDAYDPATGNLAWLLWLAAVALFAGAALSRQLSAISFQPAASGDAQAGEEQHTTRNTPHAARSTLAAWLPWVLIVGVAAALRFYQLDLVPRGLWADEAIAGLQAEDILDKGWRPLFIGGANGEPAFYLYGLAALIKLLGPTMLAVRLPMALAGTLAVPALGWLVAPLYGRRVALVAAGLLAAMTWQINFSRLGFNAAWSLPVDLLAAGCLVRGLATGRIRWYAWAGLLFGLGFQLYYISRAWLILLALLLGYRLLTERKLWRQARGGLVVLAVGLLLSAAPVLAYAAVNPTDYLARASSVAATPAVQQAGSLAPLFDSLLTHLGMWNGTGDPNGRHNLPGTRLLDPITGALLPAGLALALLGAWRARRGRVLAWPYLFPAVGLVVLLAGGVLSSPDESPQALRTLGDSSIVALLAALPLAGLWEVFTTEARRHGDFGVMSTAEATVPNGTGIRLFGRRVAWGAVLVTAVLVVVVGANYRRYFLIQEPNPNVYKEFSTPARLVVEMAQAQGPATDDFVAMGLYEQATIQYLAGHAIGTPFTTLAETPLPPGADGHAALLFLDNRNTAALDWLQQLYPHATIESVTGPEGGNALFFAIHIPAADRAAPYFVDRTTRDANGVQQQSEDTDGVAMDWSQATLSGLSLPLQVTWHGTLRPPATGVYHIVVEHSAGPAGGVRLEVAGRPLDPAGADPTLIAGRYPFTLTVTVGQAAGVTRLRWAGPLPAARAGAPVTATQVITPAMLLAPDLGTHGVTAVYRDGSDPAGPVGLVREEPSPTWFFFYTPFGVGPFVGDWRGTLIAPRSGHYTFDVDIGGQPSLWLDGQAVAWQPAGRSLLNVPLFTAGADLPAGPHTFHFQDRAPWWREPCILFWTPPGGPRAVIPNSAFLPDLWDAGP